MTVTIYKAKDGWRWRMVAKNGRIVACSGEAFFSKSNAYRSYCNVEVRVAYAKVVFE